MLTAYSRRSAVFVLAAVVFCIPFFFYLRPFSFVRISSADSVTNTIWTSSDSKHAFATFLSTRVTDESEDDPYFTATRVLVYQLLHQPETRTRQGTPLLVLVPSHVSESKREILRKEGATIIPVDLIMPHTWDASPGTDRWVDQFTKLHLFGLTQYDRILYMDNDMLVTRPLDSIWDEEAVANIQKTKYANVANMDKGMKGFKLPKEYLIAGVTDNEGPYNVRPTRVWPKSRLNGGFLVLRPCTDLFNYYLSTLDHPDVLFERAFMEMGLLNSVHRSNGPMPWIALPQGRYSNNWPTVDDLEAGSATLHDKFWLPENVEWIDRELVEMWWRVEGKMEGYWQRDAGVR